MTEYVVVKTNNFDLDVEAVKFTDYKEAVAYLQWWWEDYYNTEMAESVCLWGGSLLDEEECYHERDYAKVKWDSGDYTEFNLIEIKQKRDDFPHSYECYVC